MEFHENVTRLVGGHCIGVDPYYLTYKAESLGYHPDVILAGRRINDGMEKFVAEQVVKMLIQSDKPVKMLNWYIGMTFKENVADIRNSMVLDVINELNTYNTEILVTDAYAKNEEVKEEYGLELTSFENFRNLDALIIAVPHTKYRELTNETINSLFNGKEPVIFDIKGLFRTNSWFKSLSHYKFL